MNEVSEDYLLNILNALADPKQKAANIVEAGYIQSVEVKNGAALCILQIDPRDGPEMEELRQKAESTLLADPRIQSATVVLTADKAPGNGPDKAVPAQNAKPASSGPAPQPALAPDVRHIIAVASGKGGVGKSTIAFNLACALEQMGYRTGIMDADIYGPSIPKLSGLSGQKPGGGARDPGSPGKIEPLEAFGLKIMSIGFMVAEETPMIWRGPMVQSAILQLLRDVHWGTLDYLIVDMPPGTGDAQLTLAQKVPLSGAVIVSTPQDIALIDARKGLAMFEKVSVPVLGLIENMSYFSCPSCGERSEIFGHGGARLEAEKLEVPFLGEIPLHSVIREKSDSGLSLYDSDMDPAYKEIFLSSATRMIETLDKNAQNQGATPKIIIE